MRQPLLCGALLLLTAQLAAAAPPPGLPPVPHGIPAGPPVTLPAPKPGKAVFASVAVSGTLKPGVTKPYIEPVGVGPPPATIRAVAGQTRPVTKNGKTTITVYFAVGDIRQARMVNRITGGPEVELFHDPTQWANAGQGLMTEVTCGYVKALSKTLELRIVFGSPGDTAAEMLLDAFKKSGC